MHKDKFLSWCVTKRNLSKNSMKHTRIRYDLFFKWLGKRKLTYEIVAVYVLYLREKGLVNVSINSHLRVIALIDIFERDFHKDLHLFRTVSYLPKVRRIPIILSQNEMDAVLSVVVPYVKRFQHDGSEIDLNRNLALWIIRSTGCRLDECLSLRRCDIVLGFEQGHILIQNRLDFHVKNDLSRKVPVPLIVMNKLRTFLEKRKPTELAFQSAAGHKISNTSMEDDWHRRLELAGVTKNPHIHDMRATYVMDHLRKKTPLPDLSKLVGHKDIRTTMGYTAFNDDDLWEAAKNHPLFTKSQTPKQKLNRVWGLLGKIREELEQDKDFQNPQLTSIDGIGYAFHAILKKDAILKLKD